MKMDVYEQYFLLIGKDVITYAEIAARQEKSADYPTGKEELYLACFAAGKHKEADRLCRELIEEAAGYTFNYFSNAINHMIYSIWNVFFRNEEDMDIIEINQKSVLKRIQQYDLFLPHLKKILWYDT